MNPKIKLLISIPLTIIGIVCNFPPLDFIFCAVGGYMFGSAIADFVFKKRDEDLEN